MLVWCAAERSDHSVSVADALRAERRIDAGKQAAYIRNEAYMHLPSSTAANTPLP